MYAFFYKKLHQNTGNNEKNIPKNYFFTSALNNNPNFLTKLNEKGQ